jgi:hypothetical protein
MSLMRVLAKGVMRRRAGSTRAGRTAVQPDSNADDGAKRALNALFVAADGGPRETLAPVAAACASAMADVAADRAETESHWAALIAAGAANLLVAGTSDSGRGRRVESAARRAARSAGLAVVAIEDFPGNYYDVERGAATLVVVESAAAREVCVRKFGRDAPQIEVAVPARYDPHRARLIDARRATASSWARGERTRVLWAGQPETGDCLSSLQALLPALRAHEAELLFKAHPRDPGYGQGAYSAVLDASGVRCTDLTAARVEEALAAAPRLVATQFSSLAIEAGFYGIPGLWILLPDAGGARLLAKKGYGLPLLCAARGAAAAMSVDGVAQTLGRVLGDSAYRVNLMRRFDAYFGAGESAAPKLAASLRRLARQGK